MAENLDPSGRIGEEELVEALHKAQVSALDIGIEQQYWQVYSTF